MTENFLIWFIGFVEGDGSFFIHSVRNQMVFSITQKDEAVLREIQKQFEFGQIQSYCGPKKIALIILFQITKRLFVYWFYSMEILF